jgi:hypothetical protein
MKLLELLNTEVELEYQPSGKTPKNYVIATAKIDGKTYQFNAGKVEAPQGDYWNVGFVGSKVMHDGRRMPSYDMTGEGNQMQVLAAMKKFVGEVVNKHGATCFKFTAAHDSKSRGKVYAHMVKRWLGWKIEQEDKKTLSGSEVQYTVTKP